VSHSAAADCGRLLQADAFDQRVGMPMHQLQNAPAIFAIA
jgi:hypothetical protein